MPLQNQSGSDAANGFAAILASFTASSVTTTDKLLDGFEDDVATLSYEQALQVHGRYRPQAAAVPSQPDARPDTGSTEPRGVQLPAEAAETQAVAPDADPEAAKKRASVTLRMSRAECARLQQLAAEAGLTVSGYLRFCAFEVESLRAQVKTALAEMRAAPQQSASAGVGSRWTRLFRLHA
jgi:hypothetical protein